MNQNHDLNRITNATMTNDKRNLFHTETQK